MCISVFPSPIEHSLQLSQYLQLKTHPQCTIHITKGACYVDVRGEEEGVVNYLRC